MTLMISAKNDVFVTKGALPSPTVERFQELVDHPTRKVSFKDVILQTFGVMVKYPFAFFSDVFGWHDFSPEQNPLDGSRPRKATEDVKVFLAVLAAFPDLNGKNVFVMGPDRFIFAMARANLPTNLFPIRVGLNYGDWYTLDMHPNKKGHREIATQILEHLKKSEQGRHCLG